MQDQPNRQPVDSTLTRHLRVLEGGEEQVHAVGEEAAREALAQLDVVLAAHMSAWPTKWKCWKAAAKAHAALQSAL